MARKVYTFNSTIKTNNRVKIEMMLGKDSKLNYTLGKNNYNEHLMQHDV